MRRSRSRRRRKRKEAEASAAQAPPAPALPAPQAPQAPPPAAPAPEDGRRRRRKEKHAEPKPAPAAPVPALASPQPAKAPAPAAPVLSEEDQKKLQAEVGKKLAKLDGLSRARNRKGHGCAVLARGRRGGRARGGRWELGSGRWILTMCPDTLPSTSRPALADCTVI
ncbi:unnamed protein product [Effrenium voratum]|uniref:Uncharacterized protein n=1 Tax=Effrenium voratum TaxID=2562239 RepID=A0AA36IAC9_9DINO|nr:unnamed protein product [Effrenium voratum]